MKLPQIYVTVDTVVFKSRENPQVLLIQRKNTPFQHMWALPGGFVEEKEPLQDAAERELLEETGVSCDEMVQLHTFGSPGRDPRGRTITVVYVGYAKENSNPHASDDAKSAKWFTLEDLPTLAFDHNEIIQKAVSRFL